METSQKVDNLQPSVKAMRRRRDGAHSGKQKWHFEPVRFLGAGACPKYILCSGWRGLRFGWMTTKRFSQQLPIWLSKLSSRRKAIIRTALRQARDVSRRHLR